MNIDRGVVEENHESERSNVWRGAPWRFERRGVMSFSSDSTE